MHYFDGELSELSDKLELLNQYKLNNPYFEWYDGDNEKHYPFNSIDELQNQSNSMNFSALVDLVKLNAKQSLTIKKTVENLNGEILLYKSLKSVLFVGDYNQSYENYNPDKIVFRSNKKMDRDLQFDHIELLNDFNELIVRKGLSIKIEFLSPWNRLDVIDKGQGQAEFYYRELVKNKVYKLVDPFGQEITIRDISSEINLNFSVSCIRKMFLVPIAFDFQRDSK